MSAPSSTRTATAVAEAVYYNGFRAGEDVLVAHEANEDAAPLAGPVRAGRLGIENMATACVQGRGVMIDLVAAFGPEGAPDRLRRAGRGLRRPAGRRRAGRHGLPAHRLCHRPAGYGRRARPRAAGRHRCGPRRQRPAPAALGGRERAGRTDRRQLCRRSRCRAPRVPAATRSCRCTSSACSSSASIWASSGTCTTSPAGCAMPGATASS